MDFKLPDFNLWLMLPEIVLFLAALAVMTYDIVTRRKSGEMVGYIAMAGVALSALSLTVTDYGSGFGNMFFNDPMALFFKVVVLGAAFMAMGSSFGITREKIVNHRGEYFGLLMLSTVGMMFLASSRELISLYIGL
jgi:NADH-quinone oxidoreductase subunit N